MGRIGIVILLVAGCQNEVPPSPPIDVDGGRPGEPSDAGSGSRDANAAERRDAGAGGLDAGDPTPEPVELCDPASHLLCTDFEAGLPSAPDWSIDRFSAPLVSIDPTRAAHGVQSVQLRPLADGGGHTAAVGTVAPFPIAGDTIYGRAFYFVPSPAPGPHSVQLVSAYAATHTQWSIGFRGSEMHANVNDPDGVGEVHDRSTVPLPTDRWFCLEWMFDGATPELRIWLDGELIEALDGAAWPTAEWARIQIGMRKIHEPTDPPDGYRAWLDDVALDDERIGCGP